MKKLFSINLDFVGITLSSLCAIHCMLLPILLAMFSLTSVTFTGISFLSSKKFELLMILIAFVLGGISIWLGYRHHKKQAPYLLFIAGFSSIVLSILLLPIKIEEWFHGGGAMMIGISHIVNYHYQKKRKSH